MNNYCVFVSSAKKGVSNPSTKKRCLCVCVGSPAVWAAFLAPSSAHTYVWTLWRPSAAEASQHSHTVSSTALTGTAENVWDVIYAQLLATYCWYLQRKQTIRKRTCTEDVLTKSLSLCCFSSTSFIISVILCSLVSISCCCSSLCLNTLSICCQGYIRFFH